jgi:hypothetical protein
LLDAMILVAATAVGLAFARTYFREYFQARPLREHDWLRWTIVAGSLQSINYLPVLASWSVAMVVLRLRLPRPRLRSLAVRPGWLATCSAVTGMLLGALTLMVKHQKGVGGWLKVELFAYPIGAAVVAAWVNLAICGRWRPEPEWIDRLGRIVGACWVAMMVLISGLLLLN